jgi:hypothetical protein
MNDNSSFKEILNHQLHIRLHTCMCHKLNAMCHKLCIRLGHQQYSKLCILLIGEVMANKTSLTPPIFL